MSLTFLRKMRYSQNMKTSWKGKDYCVQLFMKSGTGFRNKPNSGCEPFKFFRAKSLFHVCVLKTQIWIMDWESRRLRVSRHLSRGRSSEPTTAPPQPKNLPARGNPINSRSTRRTPKITVSNTSMHSKDIQLLWKIRNKGNEKRSLTKVYFLS